MNLDKDYTPSLAVSDTDYVTNIIQSVTGMSQSLIDFIIEELESYSLSLVMTRMRKFRAGCRLHYIASIMPNVRYYWRLPSHLKTMVNTIAKILGKSNKAVFKSLQSIKKAQQKSSERLSIMAKLAKVYNDAGGGDKGEAEVKKAKKQLKLLMKLGSIDEAAAMKIIKKTATSQRALYHYFRNWQVYLIITEKQ